MKESPPRKFEQSIRSRLRWVSREVSQRLEHESSTDLARKIIQHHSFRRGLTHDIPVKSDKDKTRIETNGYAAILQPSDDDDDGTLETEYFRHREDAEKRVEARWGKVSGKLHNLLIRPVVIRSNWSERDLESAAVNLGGILNSLAQYHTAGTHNRLDYPESYPSEQQFFDEIGRLQDEQLGVVKTTIEHHLQFDDETGTWVLPSEEEWKDDHDITKTQYPFSKTGMAELDIQVRVPQDKKIFDLMAIEEYLAFHEADCILVALARAHPVLSEAYNKPGKRKSLLNDENLGCQEGSDKTLPTIVKEMTETGFDIQPVFDSHNRCIGTLQLSSVLDFLQSNKFSALPERLNVQSLRAYGLLTPAPPILDGLTPIHKASNILTNGLGAVIVYFDPKQWEWHDEYQTLVDQLEKGPHILTVHDLVQHKILTWDKN